MNLAVAKEGVVALRTFRARQIVQAHCATCCSLVSPLGEARGEAEARASLIRMMGKIEFRG
jgi:hypothetical protein